MANLRENPEQAILDRYFDDISGERVLSAEEENVLCQKISKGDSRALDKLVKAHLPQVVAIAKRYVKDGVSLLDLIAEGNIGLIRAAGKFDPAKGQTFQQYAAFDIRKSIQDFLPTEDVKMKRTTDNIPSGSKGDDDQSFYLADGEEMMSKLYLLPEREQVVIREFYGLGTESLTMKEIGDKYGFKRERVRQIRNTALRHLRNLRNVKSNI